MDRDLNFFIDRVISLKSFWNANYYLRCMKKAPHGGIFSVCSANFYMKHRKCNALNLFYDYTGTIPNFLSELINDELALWKECDVNIEELLSFCFEGDFWYAGFRVLKRKDNVHDDLIIWKVISNKLRFEDYFILDNIPQILYAFSCFLVQEKMILIDNLDDILHHEYLIRLHNKYGLSDITNANFGRQGFEVEGKYYLYNMFLDTSIGGASSEMPLTVSILTSIPNVKIEMRCDERLAVLSNQKIVTASLDAQRFRGIKLLWADIESLVYRSETIVHGDVENLNKLLLTVSRDQEGGQTFFHVAIEELWNPEEIHPNDKVVEVNFIHAKYFPDKKGFTHIDFSVNQYQKEIYVLKHSDSYNYKDISINKYSDIHYKVWCVEGSFIDVGIWCSLITATLDEPFRKLFYEMFSNEESSKVKE